jgi:hypothetical protein
MFRNSHIATAIAVAGLTLYSSAEAAQRAFVSSTGNDANAGCPVTAPCRTFQAAHTAVDVGGEILALDGAGYAPVTITKSVTITANPGFYAGIAASTGTAVTIATASVKVILRGLNINGIGGTTGISMTNGSRLVIENCVISNFAGAGINVATGAEVRVADTTIRDNNDGLVLSNGAHATVAGSRFFGHTTDLAGIYVNATPTGTTTTAAVSDTIFSGNFVGVYQCAVTGATGRVSITRSTASNNSYGIVQDACAGTMSTVASNNLITANGGTGLYNAGAAGTFQSLGNNTGGQNGANTSGTITGVAGF